MDEAQTRALCSWHVPDRPSSRLRAIPPDTSMRSVTWSAASAWRATSYQNLRPSGGDGASSMLLHC